MQYLGGKTKIAKKLMTAIEPVLRGRPFWEPFCGGLSMSVALSAVAAGGLVSDVNRALMATYIGVVNGWEPPDTVSEEEYAAAKLLPDEHPLKAFVGFGCSFGGKWFGGYARAPGEGGRNYAASCRRVVQRDVSSLVRRGVRFVNASFFDVAPHPTDYVLYLDPPYAGTTGYGAIGKFDHPRFYDYVYAWSRFTDVFVSEYEMPFGRVALEFAHSMSVAGGYQADARVERLYHYGPGVS